MAGYQHISHGFDPVFDERSRVLVLGSFPSALSRKNDFYYGNPSNRFWRVMAHVLGVRTPPNEGEPFADEEGGEAARAGAIATLEESIEAKRRMLLEGGIALWDVIEECDIKGSSDASIKNVVPARIERIASKAPLAAVVCNGATAGRLYKRYLQWQVGLEAHVLPSTSPANAAWSASRLATRWTEEFALIRDEVAEDEAHRAQAKAKARDEEAPRPKGGRTSYAVVGAAPAASSYAVHKSMQGNKRKDTKPELLVRERLRAAGLGGYRLQWKAPGRPDIAWPGKKVCVFVNGCFWHRCPHCNPSTPKKNVEYWTAKFNRNTERDRENAEALRAAGWRVHVIWECELKKKAIDSTMAKLLPQLARELGKPLRSESATASGDAHAAPREKQTPGAPAAPRAKGEPASERPRTRHFMYVIECADGTLYTGYTTDVEARFARHCAGTGAKYTRGRGPLNLLASAEFATKHDAMSAEYRFKKLTRDQKDALLALTASSDEPFGEVLEEKLLR